MARIKDYASILQMLVQVNKHVFQQRITNGDPNSETNI